MDISTIKNANDRAAIAAGNYAAQGNPAKADGFNLLYYLTRYPGVAASGIGGEYHYNEMGKAAGNFPNQAAENASRPSPAPPVNQAAATANTSLNTLIQNLTDAIPGVKSSALQATASGAAANAGGTPAGNNMKVVIVIAVVLVVAAIGVVVFKKLLK